MLDRHRGAHPLVWVGGTENLGEPSPDDLAGGAIGARSLADPRLQHAQWGIFPRPRWEHAEPWLHQAGLAQRSRTQPHGFLVAGGGDQGQQAVARGYSAPD